MNRRNQVLSVILGIQIVIGIAIFWPRSTASSAQSGPLLADFNTESVISLTLTEPEGKHVVLAKASDGWVLPEADGFPAADDKVTSLLEKIGNLQANRQVTRTESSHKRLKVAEDDFVRMIELESAEGNYHKLYIGSAPRTSAVHIRLDNRPETYLTGELASYEADASAARWIDTLYYTVPQTRTVALTLENENGKLAFERGEEENWTMAGLAGAEVFAESAFTSLLGQVASLRMVEPIGKEEQDWFGLGRPQSVVTLTTDDGQVSTLRIGAKDEESNGYVAKWSESPYYVLVAEYTADNLINKTRSDFIETPSTPPSEPDTGPAEEAPADGS